MTPNHDLVSVTNHQKCTTNLHQKCTTWQIKISQCTCRERMPHRPPTPLTGLQHAWFFSVHLNKASVLVNVVETVPAMQWAG